MAFDSLTEKLQNVFKIIVPYADGDISLLSHSPLVYGVLTYLSPVLFWLHSQELD